MYTLLTYLVLIFYQVALVRCQILDGPDFGGISHEKSKKLKVIRSWRAAVFAYYFLIMSLPSNKAVFTKRMYLAGIDPVGELYQLAFRYPFGEDSLFHTG